MKKLLLSFIFLLLIYNVSAGLIVNKTLLSSNKTVGVNDNIIIQVTNNESFTFFNISMEDNSYIIFPQIPVLTPGQSAFVNSSIVSDVGGTYNIKLKGFYLSNLGQEFKSYHINITSTSPFLSSCDMTIVDGDTVTWHNQILDSVVMKSSPLNIPVEGGAVTTNSTFIKTFTGSQTLSYYFQRSSFTFTPTCSITSLNATGLINNPQYDSTITLVLNPQFQQTTLTYNLVTSNYTMNFNGRQDGIMTVTNNGNKKAFNVRLTGDWLTFNQNAFDLEIGETKGIVYTIIPIITATEQTGQAYTKNIGVSGNFGALSIPLSIFINHAELGPSNSSDSDYLIKVFCPLYPNSTLCNPPPRVEYRYIGNNSDMPINVTMTQQQLNDLWLYMFNQGDEFKTKTNHIDQTIAEVSLKQNASSTDLSQLKEQFISDSAARQSTVNGVLVFVGISVVVLTCALAGFIIYSYKRDKKLTELRKW